MLNAAANLVACAHDDESPTVGPLAFCKVPHLEIFVAEGFQVVSVDLMTSGLRTDDVAALGADEQAEITYHRPDRVGDVLFNWFD